MFTKTQRGYNINKDFVITLLRGGLLLMGGVDILRGTFYDNSPRGALIFGT